MKNVTETWYSGNVNVKLKIKDRVFSFQSHNEGLPALFESFARIMSGNYRGDCDIPKYIDVRKLVPGTTDDFLSYLTINRLPLTGASWKVDNQGRFVANFTAVISSDMLYAAVPVDSTDVFMLYLVTDTEDKTGKRDLARLEIPAEQLSRIAPGVNAIIEWSMRMTNPDEG